MATAPRPGVTARNEQATAAKKIIRMTIRGEERSIAPGNLPLQERLICRKATTYPVETFVDEGRFGEDSLMVLWWLAGRRDDPFLTLTKVEEEWPADLTGDDIDVEVEDVDEIGGEDTPEPSGPNS